MKLFTLSEEGILDKASEAKAHDNNVDCMKFLNNNLLMTMTRDNIKFWDIREATNTLKSLSKPEKKTKSEYLRFSPSYT